MPLTRLDALWCCGWFPFQNKRNCWYTVSVKRSLRSRNESSGSLIYMQRTMMTMWGLWCFLRLQRSRHMFSFQWLQNGKAVDKTAETQIRKCFQIKTIYDKIKHKVTHIKNDFICRRDHIRHGCGDRFAAFSCPVSGCLYGGAAQGFFDHW